MAQQSEEEQAQMALPHAWGRNDLGAQMLPPVSPLSPGVTLHGTHFHPRPLPTAWAQRQPESA